MIDIRYGRYVPTLNTNHNKNVFRSNIEWYEYNQELTNAMKKSKDWLDNHFGFVLLYHNNHILKRFCNYKLFEKTFKDLNIIIELENHIEV